MSDMAERASDANRGAVHSLDALSRLAGEIGHELRNLLMIIRNYAEFIGETLPDDSQARDDLAELVEAVERGALLTNQLLAFGRRATAGTRATDVAQAVAAAEPRLRALLSDDVELRIELAPDLPVVEADAERIGQILETVVRDAVKTLRGPGAIRVEASARNVEAARTRAHRDVVPGRYVALAVSSTVAAIAGEMADQVHDPVFMTRPGGHSGLALAVVHGVVESWGGAVEVQSEHGVATVVRALLPCTSTVGDDSSTGDLDAAGATVAGRVLVCTDERAIGSMCERALRRAGFEVLVAEEGDAGLCHLDEQHAAGRALDLLVSDIVISGCSGLDVAAAARERFPAIAIVLMTGPGDALAARRVPDGTLVLEKPFPAALLVRRARALVALGRL